MNIELSCASACALWESLTTEYVGITSVGEVDPQTGRRKEWVQAAGNPTKLGIIAVSMGVPTGTHVYEGEARVIVAQFLQAWAEKLLEESEGSNPDEPPPED